PAARIITELDATVSGTSDRITSCDTTTEMGTQPETTRRRFSIIIPTYNRPRQLAACIDSLAKLDFPADSFEVIVVNDGGCTPAIPMSELNVLWLNQAHAGPGAARNFAAQYAGGEILVFLDDDCRPAPNWLRSLDERSR